MRREKDGGQFSAARCFTVKDGILGMPGFGTGFETTHSSHSMDTEGVHIINPATSWIWRISVPFQHGSVDIWGYHQHNGWPDIVRSKPY